MPISVLDLFAGTDTAQIGVVRWGESVPSRLPGVYCVSATKDPSAHLVDRPAYALSPSVYSRLVAARPHLSIDGSPATQTRFADRLGSFWIPNEPVLYIGLAGTSLHGRLQQFYRTKIGDRSPHAGGWWLKTLRDLDELYVHFAEWENTATMERGMLERFAATIDPKQRALLFDQQRIAPFANVAVRRGINKRHGLSHYTSDPAPPAVAGKSPETPRPAIAENLVKHQSNQAAGLIPQDPDPSQIVYSQPVTDRDRAGNNLRIPAISKFAFPTAPGEVSVVIDGERTSARWRPNGSRSGTLGLGVKVMRSLNERTERIRISVVDGSYFILRK